jgi:hypothetical protein
MAAIASADHVQRKFGHVLALAGAALTTILLSRQDVA